MASDPASGPTTRPADLHSDHVRDGVVVPAGGARLWALVGLVAAVASVWIVPFGIVGMVAGSVAHLKGQRLGLLVAGLAALGTIVGMTLVFWTRLG